MTGSAVKTDLIVIESFLTTGYDYFICTAAKMHSYMIDLTMNWNFFESSFATFLFSYMNYRSSFYSFVYFFLTTLLYLLITSFFFFFFFYAPTFLIALLIFSANLFKNIALIFLPVLKYS